MFILLAQLSISDWTGIIQALGVVISLIYLAVQIKDNTRAVKSATYQSIISSYAEIESRIEQNPDVARIFRVGCQKHTELNEDEYLRFTQIICSMFNFFENLHYQYSNRVLDENLWSGWCRLMRKLLKNPGVQYYWQENNKLYSEKFQKYIKNGKCPK